MTERTQSVRTLGVLGGGQLGWMLGTAARRLGIECVFLDPAERCPADMIGRRIRTAYDDREGLRRLADEADVVTYEFENVPADAAAWLGEHLPVRPGPRSLETSQDRLVEKTFIRSLGVPVPRFAAIDDRRSLETALQTVGEAAIFKTRRGGYDGKGQARFRVGEDPAEALATLGGVPAIAEALVPFDLEASTLVVRGIDGETRTWHPIRNEHAGGILRRSDSPGPGISAAAEAAMRSHAVTIANALEHVGVLAVEFFVIGDDVLVNEMAPRVHNSGHLTIEHAHASQFENHVRAVAGLPLRSTDSRFRSATMLNAIGDRPRPADLESAGAKEVDTLGDGPVPVEAGAIRWHDYRKSSRTGRKVGHLTIVDDGIRDSRVARLATIVPGASEAPSLATGR
ncbi:MAG: 5-(carboxyamino)imidazole ribonucleotide synthase [Phycisphaera sp.]|nr:5-(carboxyamino)imidazole ribonucleotide synthase [Phycisphaera sp.]